MRIAIKPQAHGGAVSWFRGTGPGHYLSERHSVPILNTTELRRQGLTKDEAHEQQARYVREADVIHAISPAGAFEETPPEWRERRGVLSVDLDDDVWVWLEDPARARAEQAGMTVAPLQKGKAVSGESIRELESWLRAADLVTTTTDALAATIRERVPGAKVQVIPNAIPPEAQKLHDKARTDYLTANPKKPSKVLAKLGRVPPPHDRIVGWTGSIAHIDDLPPFLEALARLRSVDGALLVRSLGPVDFMLSPGFRRQFTGTHDYAPVQYRNPKSLTLEPQVPFELYYDTLEAMSPNVAAIPVRESPFNRGKSAVTLYSWAAQGVPCVVSETGPYAEAKKQGFPARYVPHEDKDAWATALRDLLYEPAAARALGAQAHAWVMQHHAFPRAAEAWETAWRGACAAKGIATYEREGVR